MNEDIEIQSAPTRLFDRDLPPELVQLYQDVLDARPDARLNLVRGMPEGSRLDGRHTPDRDGNSEVRIAAEWDFGVLTHQLLHALFYRRGFPFASVLPFEAAFSTVAQIIACTVSHPSFYTEAQERGLPDACWRDKLVAYAKLDQPDAPALYEQSLIDAWRLADAIFVAPEAVADLQARCRSDYPQTWAVTEKLLQTMDRCRTMSGLGWRRAMIDLLGYFDAMAREHHPEVLPPAKSIAVSLVLTEQQLKRPAERMIEVLSLDNTVAAFVNKQDKSLFHFRYLAPKTQKQELAQLRNQVKQKKTEDVLDENWVQYTVDLRTGKSATER